MSEKKAQRQVAEETSCYVDTPRGHWLRAVHGWSKHSNFGNPVTIRNTYDVDGNLISSEKVNTDEEIQAALPGTRIYDVIDRINKGAVPVYNAQGSYQDLTEQPETDADALRFAKEAEEIRKAKYKAALDAANAASKEGEELKKEEVRSLDLTAEQLEAAYQKLKAQMEVKKNEQ